MLFLPDTLSATYWMCLLNDKEGSRLTPNILGHLTSGRCEFSMNILGWILAWCVSGVINVTEDFGRKSANNCSLGTQLFPLGSCLY